MKKNKLLKVLASITAVGTIGTSVIVGTSSCNDTPNFNFLTLSSSNTN
jgi:hypothetical protein